MSIPIGTWSSGSRASLIVSIQAETGNGPSQDVGRMDSPDLAAYVAESVNYRQKVEGGLTEALATRDEALRAALTLRSELDAALAVLAAVDLAANGGDLGDTERVAGVREALINADEVTPHRTDRLSVLRDALQAIEANPDASPSDLRIVRAALAAEGAVTARRSSGREDPVWSP